MKNILLYLQRTPVKALLLATTLLTLSQFAQAQTTTWVGAGADQFWSTPANWTTSGGSTPPGPTDNVIFPNGTFPVSVDGYDNIVGSSTAIGSLSYLNTAGTRTTHINDGQTLTVNGPFTEGVATFTTVVTMSGTGNFTVNNLAGSFSVGGNGGSTETVTLTLADGTNTLNLKTLSVGESAGNNGRNCVVNLGAGPTLINADVINLGTGKASGTLQWTDPTFTNKIVIRDHTGSGRAFLQMGTGSSGSGSSKGNILASGHPFDALVSTNILSGCTDTGTGNSAILQFDNGVLDVTTIIMGRSTSSTGAAVGSLNVGGSTNSATLIVNSPTGPGLGTFLISDSTNSSVSKAAGTLSVSNNGVAQIYTSILKVRVLTNTATINIIGGTLNMEGETNTIGTPSVPIDNMNLDNASLTFYEDGSSLNAAVGALTLAETNVFTIKTLPVVGILPTVIPVITFTSVSSLDGNSSNLVLNPLPGSYTGYLTNDGIGAISLVITNGPVFTKPVSWGGGSTNLWDTTSFVWTNGTTLTNYSEGDFVTFNDGGLSGTVNLTKAHTPSSLAVNNNTVNYAFSGVGAIKGQTSLVKMGTGSLTLSESGGDTIAGGIFVHGGTLVLDNANSVINSGLTNDAGTVVQVGNNDGNGALPGGLVENDGSLVFNLTSNRTVATVISGAGSVTQAGSNTLTLTAANTYGGNTIVSGGTLTLSGAGMVSSPVMSVRNATLNITTANTPTFNSVTLTNGTLNVGTGTNLPSLTALSITNSTITFIADYNNAGGTPILAAGLVTSGGTANTLNVTSILNLPLSPAMPFHLPLVSYSSFSGPFNFVWTNLPGISGYITNNTTSSSIDLVITNAPQNLVWNGGSATGNNWSDAANWTGVSITPLDALTFDGLLRTNNVNDTPAGTTYAGITFNNSAGDAPFTVSGAPVNITGTILNNSADVQTVNLGLNVNGGVTLDGGTVGGSLAIRGGITNFSTGGQTVTLLDIGTVADLWATNSATNGGGQLTLQVGNAGGDWTIVDGTGSSSQVQVGNLQLSLNVGSTGGTLEFGSSNSAPNVDAGFPSNGVVNVGATSGTFAMNNGTLKAGSMTVGASVQGNLNVNGGTLILGTGGFSAGGGVGASIFTGTITNGSIYATNNGSFIISQRGLGTVTMTGGLLDCNTLNLTTGTAASGNGIFTLSGGRLICTNLSVGSSSGNGSGTLNFNGGTLQPGTNTLALFKQNNLVPLTNNVQAGGAIFDTAGFNATVNWPLQTDPALGGLPDGGLTKLGAGTLTLTSPNTYVGNTAVGGGTLIINGVQPASAVTVSNGATLGGNGVVSNVTVNAGGTLSPGNNAIGILTVGGDVSLAGTTTMEINKTLGTNDLLRATNSTPSTITYGGTLNVPVVAGTLVAGDTFKFFSASNYVGSFTAINPPNVTWNTSSLNVNGTLTVVSVTPPGPTTNANITKVTLSGTNLLVHGTNNNVPNNMLHYVVLTSTNITKPLSNWTPVVTNTYNGDGTFDFSSPIVPGAPQQFIDVKAVQ